MKNFYQGAALECEFCHRKFKEDELVIVGDNSRKVFCCSTSVQVGPVLVSNVPGAGNTDNSEIGKKYQEAIAQARRDQLICVRGFEKNNPGHRESATVLIYRGGACSCVNPTKKA